MDTAGPGEFDYLCREFEGFYHFGKVLEHLAQAIADGVIDVPDVDWVEA